MAHETFGATRTLPQLAGDRLQAIAWINPTSLPGLTDEQAAALNAYRGELSQIYLGTVSATALPAVPAFLP